MGGFRNLIIGRPRCAAAPAWWLLALAIGCGGGNPSAQRGAAEADARLAQTEERKAPDASAAVKQGEAKLQANDAAGAKEAFEQALAQNPRDARAALDLGIASEMLGDLGAAEAAYRKALGIDPGFAEAQNNLGVLLRESGQLDEAVQLLSSAAKANPDSAAAHQNLALALEDQKQLERAGAEYERALELAPDDAMTRANYGLLLLKLDQKEQAARELSQALGQTKERAALLAIGNGLRRAGDAKGAVQAMERAVAAGEPTPALLSELALAQRAAGMDVQAMASLDRALGLDGRYALAYYLKGNMLAADKKFGDAKKAFEQYLKIAPNGEQAANAKARLQMLQKQK
ncbi:MAG TPA: tetratricopeptide repeat protein [Polyangiales bacterium]|nr:tetratricopeptide repeat protein [Polyangiales bacterium]